MDSSITLSSLNFIKFIDQTIKSSVLLYQHFKTNKKYLVKAVSKSNHQQMQNDKLDHEYNMVSHISHPNIIRFLGKGCTETKAFIISEYMELGDLYGFIQKFGSRVVCFPQIKSFVQQEAFWRTLFIQVVNALVFLEKNSIAHCDVKPENIVLNEEFEAKLIDFEFYFRTIDQSNKEINCNKFWGSVSYMAPEIRELKKKPNCEYNPHFSDMFSLGTTFINLVFGNDFFGDDIQGSGNFNMKSIKNKNFDNIWKNCDKNNLVSHDFKDMAEKMLAYNPEERITFKKLKSHQWFNETMLSKDEMKSLIFNKKFIASEKYL